MFSLPKLIISTASLFIVVPALVSVIRYRKMSYALKTMACYVLLGGFTQIYSSYLGSQKLNNLWVLHWYTPLEFACITWFFSTVLKGFIPQKVFVGLAISFAVLSTLNSMFLQNTETFNTYARSLEGILVILLCLVWCYRTLMEMKIQHLEQDPVFWVNTGFLLYFSGNVLLFAFSNYILNINHALNQYIWAFHALFSILLYSLITIGLWKAK